MKVFNESWEAVIGLEIHVQLSTNSKLFSGASTNFGALVRYKIPLMPFFFVGLYIIYYKIKNENIQN